MAVKISEVRPMAVSGLRRDRNRLADDEFHFTLRRSEEEGLIPRLREMMNDIATQGKRLADHMDIKDMRKYRVLVSDFLEEAVSHSHLFTRENVLDRRGRHRVYGLIKLVNNDLDDMTREMLSTEKDHMIILDKIDEIRGLLLDILA
jgi:uncharacterized protein YaaR (DUF327 family)